MKQCTRCKRILDDGAFGTDTRRKSGMRSACRECERVAQRNKRAQDPGLGMRQWSRRQDRIDTGREGKISWKTDYQRMLQDYGRVCYLCGLPEGEGDMVLTMDHVVPLCRGGKHTLENIRPAHRRCNGIKGKRLLEELDLTALGWRPKLKVRRNRHGTK